MDSLLGWLAIFGSIICFGSFGVPIKTPSVRAANVHPLVMQSYKSTVTFITSWIVYIFLPLNFTWWGTVSAASWVPGGVCAVFAINNCGLAIGQAVWSSGIVLVSFTWGVLYFKETIDPPWAAIVAILMICISMVGMAKYSDPNRNPSLSKYKQVSTIEGDEEIQTGSFHKSIVIEDKDEIIRKRLMGIAFAVLNGVLGGCISVPLKIAQNNGTKTGINFVISFGIGVAIVTTVLWILLFISKGCKFSKLPSIHFNVTLIPGLMAGTLWAIGNFLSMYAVLKIGVAVAYPLAQASMIVSGGFGVFYYKEVKGRDSIIWMGFVLLCTGGMSLLGWSGK